MKPKGRPKKLRLIKKEPYIVKFSPRGKPGRPEEIVLNMDEFEAIRLSDHLGFKQRQAARSMGVSQQTFSRILKRARRALADVIINGKIARIKQTDFAIISEKNIQ